LSRRYRVIAPGRVNLIGEHTDYNDLPVLPMAIDRSVEIEFEVLDEPVLRLQTSLAGYGVARFPLNPDMGRAPQGEWSNYLRAAALGLLEEGLPLDHGIAGTVGGTVPLAAGLSSSSALVVATALALLRANGHEMDPLRLAGLMARAERFVGLEGGGMDQAVCLAGRRGMAVRIDFAPLRVGLIPIPDGWRWLIAHSLVEAEKSGAARTAYNERSATCREALRTLAGSWDEPALTYKALVGREGAVAAAATELDERVFRRFRHVISEARRVGEAQIALEGNDLHRFGNLMSASHASLRGDYDVSIPELDEMVGIATSAGAYGARLTGAGFGGCIVALCGPENLEAVKDALVAQYYARRAISGLETPGSPTTADRLFEVRASDGARVI